MGEAGVMLEGGRGRDRGAFRGGMRKCDSDIGAHVGNMGSGGGEGEGLEVLLVRLEIGGLWWL